MLDADRTRIKRLFPSHSTRRHSLRNPSTGAAADLTSRTTASRLFSSSTSSSDDDNDNNDAIRGGDDDVEPTDIVAGAPLWPCGDALDQRLTKIALPCIANFAINPLIGAVDLFWVNRMGNALAVAGQAAANQVFSSAFWLASFLPSGMFSCVVLLSFRCST